MLINRYKFLISAALVCLIIVTACTPGLTQSSSNPGQGADPGANTGQAGGKNGEQGPMQDAGIDTGKPPAAEGLPAEQGQGENSAPGGEGGIAEEPASQLQAPSAKVTEYADSTYKFKLSYPENFVFRRLPAEKLASLEPKPDAIFTITNPSLAANEQAGIGPGDLEVRTYAATGQANLENWLRSASLLPTDMKAKPFKTDHVSGFEVCSATLMGPGCSYFFMSSGWIYQLIPASIDGETMIKSFVLTQ
jgi:hypothetical protein